MNKPTTDALSEARKDDHWRLTVQTDVSASHGSGLNRWRFAHRALPEINLSEVTLKTNFLGTPVGAPLMISSMTGGGSANTLNMNRRLALAAAKFGLPMGLGSQRGLLTRNDSEYRRSFTIVRELNPDGWIASNIGGQQLPEHSPEQILKLVEAVNANALIIHLNPLQELIQPEGDRHFKGILEAIKNLRNFPLPLIIKETGCGFSQADLQLIAQHLPGVHLDVAGFGGTHWGYLEGLRATDPAVRTLGERFRNWGVPTEESLRWAAKILPDRTLLASGGITSGQDILKCLCLGANMVAMAKPFAVAAQNDCLDDFISLTLQELRISMLLVGVTRVAQLNQTLLIPA